MDIREQEEAGENPFVGGDPLIILIRRKLHVDVVFATIGIVLLLHVPIAVAIVKDDLWQSTIGRPGVSNNPGFWFLSFVAYPATVFFFLWMPDGVWNVLTGLKDNGAIKEDGRLRQYLEDFSNFYKHWIWALLCLLVVLALNIFLLHPIYSTRLLWWTRGEFIFWYNLSLLAFYAFLLALIVARILVAILWFNRLFRRFEIRVKILHPDGAGGLSPLGGFSVKIGYLIGIYGLTLVIIVLSQNITVSGEVSPQVNPPTILASFLYFVLAPISFFAPIGSAHSAMGKARDEFALRISERFDEEFVRLQASLGEGTEQIKASMEKIEQLQAMHAIVTGFPIWPFNTENTIRFFSSILSPILLVIISALITILFE